MTGTPSAVSVSAHASGSFMRAGLAMLSGMPPVPLMISGSCM